MARQHEAFLVGLGMGKVVRKEFMRELSAAEDGDIEELILDSEEADDAAHYDVPALRSAVESDLEILRELAEEASRVKRTTDPKLAALIEELAHIAAQAERDALDAEDARQKRESLMGHLRAPLPG